jgi:type III pantothenate kinase
MLLAIDVGNDGIKFGVFNGERRIHDWRIPTRLDSTADELGLAFIQLMREADIDARAIDGAAISSVVPPMNARLADAVRRYFSCEPLLVVPGVKTGLKIRYEDPREVGADRIVAALAAFRKYGGPLIIIDFGTGTTYDAVSREGEYLGGAIAPGVQISIDALVQHGARLFRVELKPPPSVIGRTTGESLQAGIIYGFVAQVEGMVARLRKELGADARVIATGGMADVIAPETTIIEEVDDGLMLDGLRLVHELNAPRAKVGD